MSLCYYEASFKNICQLELHSRTSFYVYKKNSVNVWSLVFRSKNKNMFMCVVWFPIWSNESYFQQILFLSQQVIIPSSSGSDLRPDGLLVEKNRGYRVRGSIYWFMTNLYITWFTFTYKYLLINDTVFILYYGFSHSQPFNVFAVFIKANIKIASLSIVKDTWIEWEKLINNIIRCTQSGQTRKVAPSTKCIRPMSFSRACSV